MTRHVATALCLLLWGVWAFFPKLAHKELKDTFSGVLYQALSGLLWTVLLFGALGLGRVAPGVFSALHLPVPQLVWSPRGALFACIAGVAGAVGSIFYYVATAKAQVSVVSSVTALYPLVTIALAWRFLGERLRPLQWVGVALAVVAMALLAPGAESRE